MSGTKSTGWLCSRKRIAGGGSKQQHFVFIHFLSIFCKWKRCRRNGDSVAPEKLDLPLVFVCGFCLLSFCNHHHQFCYSTPTPHRISPVEIVVLNSNGLFLVSCYYSPKPIDVQCCELTPISCQIKICLLKVLWRLWLWSRPCCHPHRRPSAYLGKSTHFEDLRYKMIFTLQQQFLKSENIPRQMSKNCPNLFSSRYFLILWSQLP